VTATDSAQHLLFLLATILLAAPAAAAGPEQLEQVEPEGGAWQSEYYGEFGSTGRFGRSHALEALYGVSDRLALGVEIEGEAEAGDFTVEEVGALALLRLTDPETAPLGVGTLLSASFDRDGNLSEAEARLIVERQDERSWLQLNVMLRHVDEEDGSSELLAYGWNASGKVADIFWLGVEGSGQPARLGGLEAGFENGHFVGPAALFEFEPSANSELELGIAWFGRFAGEGPKSTVRFFAQFGF
jgi:hypothetical protein